MLHSIVIYILLLGVAQYYIALQFTALHSTTPIHTCAEPPTALYSASLYSTALTFTVPDRTTFHTTIVTTEDQRQNIFKHKRPVCPLFSFLYQYSFTFYGNFYSIFKL